MPVPRDLEVPFAITCNCGFIITGERHAQEQAIPCPRCQHLIFVLPLSPWPPLESISREAYRQSMPFETSRLSSARKRPGWLLIVFGLTIAILIGVVCFQVYLLPPLSPIPDENPKLSLEQIEAEKHNADRHLSVGHFSLARKALEKAILLGQKINALSAPEIYLLQKREREVAIFADLLEEPLETIVEHAIRLPPEEWSLDFDRRYKDRSLIFDLQMRRRLDGKVEANFPLEVRGEPVQLDLDSLSVFQQGWPGDLGWQRVIFGARLDSLNRPKAGAWRIAFTATSGVLITDPQALSICCPPLGDKATRELLKKQARRKSGEK